MVKLIEHPADYMIEDENDLAKLDSSEQHYGDLAHTAGYDRVWELGAEGWVEV
jgi:hypothetical protein